MIRSLHAGIPKPGDIVLKRVSDGSHQYALSASGDVAQIVCATYEAAIAEAGRFASAKGVDVWQTDDNQTFSRIVQCDPTVRSEPRTHEPNA